MLPKHRNTATTPVFYRGFDVSPESGGETSAGAIRAAGCFASGEQLPGHFAGPACSKHREAHHSSGVGTGKIEQPGTVPAVAPFGLAVDGRQGLGFVGHLQPAICDWDATAALLLVAHDLGG